MFVFSIEIQTASRIGMKFGREVVLEGGKVLGDGPVPPTSRPPVWGASGASGVCFGENFIKQKL